MMNIALIGIGGFGDSVLCALKAMEAHKELRIAAVSDVQYERNREKISELEASGARYYRDYVDMLAAEGAADAVAIATPIHLHKEMAVRAMEAGFHVLMEKPPATTIQDLEVIIDAAERTGKLCAVDFQRSSDKAFLELKQGIAGGLLGNIRAITGVGLWQRLDSYYARTSWAGKLMMAGNYVLDGTVCNPLAHLVNNMLLLARLAPNGAGAAVSKVTAELYHAHDIEGEDTSCLKAEMSDSVLLYFYATLCNDKNETPYIIVDGDLGTAYWDFDHNLRFETKEGEVDGREYPLDHQGYIGCNPLIVNMVRNLIDVACGREERLYCSVKDTRSYTQVLNGAFMSSRGTHGIPGRFCKRYPCGDSIATHLAGIKDLILQAAEKKKLFSEMGAEWAVAGRETDIKDFETFSMQFR